MQAKVIITLSESIFPRFLFLFPATYLCVIEGKGDIFQFSTIWVSKHVTHDLWNIWTYKPITDIANSSCSVNNREPKWRGGWEIFLNWIFQPRYLWTYMISSPISKLVVNFTLMSMESQDHKPIPLIDHTEKGRYHMGNHVSKTLDN